MLLPTLVLAAAFTPLPHGPHGPHARTRVTPPRLRPPRAAPPRADLVAHLPPVAAGRSLLVPGGCSARARVSGGCSAGLLRSAPRARRAPPPRLELGLQVDPLATGSTLFVFGLLALLQLKIKSAEASRGTRDQAVETYRQAEVLLLAGKATPDEVQRALNAAEEAVAAYDDSRRIASLPGALLRLPDPTATEVERILKRQPQQPGGQPAPPGATPAAAPPPPPSAPPSAPREARPTDDPLEGVRRALRLREAETPSEAPSGSSLLPTGSASLTLKDVAIGIALALQICWFLLSLTDPMGTPNPILNAALSSGGEMVDQMEGRRAAESDEYAAMLRQAVESGDAPPTCATRKLDDPEGGCSGSDGRASGLGFGELTRTQGLDANRAWITGPTGSGSVGTPPGF